MKYLQRPGPFSYLPQKSDTQFNFADLSDAETTVSLQSVLPSAHLLPPTAVRPSASHPLACVCHPYLTLPKWPCPSCLGGFVPHLTHYLSTNPSSLSHLAEVSSPSHAPSSPKWPPIRLPIIPISPCRSGHTLPRSTAHPSARHPKLTHWRPSVYPSIRPSVLSAPT